MLQVGDKVYSWDFSKNNHELCEISLEPVIGTVEQVDAGRGEVVLFNIMNEKLYRRKDENIFLVGTGPAIKKPLLFSGNDVYLVG